MTFPGYLYARKGGSTESHRLSRESGPFHQEEGPRTARRPPSRTLSQDQAPRTAISEIRNSPTAGQPADLQSYPGSRCGRPSFRRHEELPGPIAASPRVAGSLGRPIHPRIPVALRGPIHESGTEQAVRYRRIQVKEAAGIGWAGRGFRRNLRPARGTLTCLRVADAC